MLGEVGKIVMKKHVKVSIVFFLFSLILVVDVVEAEGQSSGKDRLDEIYARFDFVKSVKADFVQIKKSPAFKKPQVEEGSFYSSSSGELVWKVDRPAKSVFVVKGKRATVKYPELGYKKTYNLTEAGSPLGYVVESIFSIVGVGGADEIKRRYGYRIKGSWKEGFNITLVPKSVIVKKIIEKIVLEITAADFIKSIKIFESGGSLTEIKFRNVVFNPSDEPRKQ